jgi:hypothetical protein
MRLEVVRRHTGVFKCPNQGIGSNFHILRGLYDLLRNVAIPWIDAKLIRFLGFEAIREEAFDRAVARRRFVHDAQQFHPLVDIDVGDRIAVDAGNDFLSEGGLAGDSHERGDRGGHAKTYAQISDARATVPSRIVFCLHDLVLSIFLGLDLIVSSYDLIEQACNFFKVMHEMPGEGKVA